MPGSIAGPQKCAPRRQPSLGKCLGWIVRMDRAQPSRAQPKDEGHRLRNRRLVAGDGDKMSMTDAGFCGRIMAHVMTLVLQVIYGAVNGGVYGLGATRI